TLAVAAGMHWNSGDQIVLASTDFMKVTYRGLGTEADPDLFSDQTEALAVVSSSAQNQTVTCSQLTYQHFGGTVSPGNNVDGSAEVGLLNRSIRIEGASSSYPGQVRFQKSGSTTPIVHIDWTEFTHLGSLDLTGGGYPVHFHMLGTVGTNDCSVKQCSLHDNYH